MTTETQSTLYSALRNRNRALEKLVGALEDYRDALADLCTLPTAAEGTADERLRALVQLDAAKRACAGSRDLLAKRVEEFDEYDDAVTDAARTALAEDFGAPGVQG